MDDAEALTAHYALHSNAEVVHIQPGEDYPIVTSKNGCRKVVVRGMMTRKWFLFFGSFTPDLLIYVCVRERE